LTSCGACGTACNPANATGECVNGQCRIRACFAGFADCNNNPTDGCETNLHVDPNHCTACGMKCAIANAINACADGCYATACQFGWDDCNFDLAKDGCETSVLSDPQNCGGCKKTCTALPNATALCVNGACALGACKPGFTDCDGDPKTGCESDVNSDAKNCGACGKACPLNLPGCLNGVCVMSPCLGNPNWMRVSCTTGEWVWSMDKTKAKTLQDAAKNRVLTTGCGHAGAPQPQTSQGLCSLDGKGWVSTKTFTMANCNTSWYHIGGRHTGDCGGHDGDTYRLLVLTDNDCYSY
jgi:hypothetical protein